MSCGSMGVWKEPDVCIRFSSHSGHIEGWLLSFLLLYTYVTVMKLKTKQNKKKKPTKKQIPTRVVDCGHNSFGKVVAKGPKFSL